MASGAGREGLERGLSALLPAARLEETRLQGTPSIRLLLLNADYPQGGLTAAEVRHLMDNPLYWVFCWASGRVLAQYLLANPGFVAGKTVLDFGSGSGVVAIAAALAGAARVIACDIDPLALAATGCNAELNGVELELVADYSELSAAIDLILVADVLYDRANLPCLERLAQRAERVLVADSRLKSFDVPPYREVGRFSSSTLPDLDESPEFRDVRIYLAG